MPLEIARSSSCECATSSAEYGTSPWQLSNHSAARRPVTAATSQLAGAGWHLLAACAHALEDGGAAASRAVPTAPGRGRAMMKVALSVVATGCARLKARCNKLLTMSLAAAANEIAPLFFDIFERNQLPDNITRIKFRALPRGAVRCL